MNTINREFAVFPIKKLNNRQERHRFANEATRCAEYLQHIIDEFVDLLFDTSHNAPYKIIYLHFLDLWQKTCEHLKTVKPRFRMTAIDPEFFARQYASRV